MGKLRANEDRVEYKLLIVLINTYCILYKYIFAYWLYSKPFSNNNISILQLILNGRRQLLGVPWKNIHMVTP